MSKDIRSYFLCSKQSSQKKNATEDKPRKTSAILSSDEDEVDSNPSKNKKTKSADSKKSKNNDSKARSKKRTIISSDEDEEKVTNHSKSKKAKVVNNKNDSNHVEEKVDITEILSKKPVKRVNAVKVTKKTSEESVKKSVANLNEDFMNDDGFDATLNQLDTSQPEDDYLSTINNETTSKAKDVFDSQKENDIFDAKHKNTEGKREKKMFDSRKKEKDISDSKKKEKYVSDSEDKEKSTNKKTSPAKKHKTKEKDHTETKHKNDKDKKKKDLSSSKLEVEKAVKSHETSSVAKDTDYNDIIQEKIEKKKQNIILYHNYLNRGGARNPGSKEIPQGADQCLANLSFLITGVLDSLERQEVEDIIKQYGGKILHSVSKKLNYIMIGSEPGPAKMAKAESLGIKKISEDDFLELLRTRPSGVKNKNLSTSFDNNKRKRKDSSSHNDDKSPENIKKNKEDSSPKHEHKSPEKIKMNKEGSSLRDTYKSSEKTNTKNKSPIKNIISESTKLEIENKETKSSEFLISNITNKVDDGIDYTTALVEKYRPKELKRIIGQNSDKSNAKKLQIWLSNWHKNHSKNSKAPKPKFPLRDDTGTIYKAALLSGPPGVGKTTTAYVVCAELGYEVLEFNASDTRSKRLLQQEIVGILSNKTVKSFMTNVLDKVKTPPKHVLLMDEVDGMAGNEDRGGMQELIAFIKSTEVPIICICNDRNSQKIRTLANYTFDLRFQKPRVDQIKAAMMSVCFKEGIKITPEELTLIIQSTNQDIRQVINHLAILSAKSQIITENKEKMKFKNLKLGPWDVVRKVFSAEEHKRMSIHDKSDLFFHDYNIAPLFVEENYLIVTPNGPKSELYQKLAKCSESLAIGDVIENTIRGNQAWNLLPVQACFSSVIPGSVMSGFLNSQINFPSWLGRNSKKSKCDRLLQDITVHARITTGASKEAINLDYLKMLVDSIVRPLAVEDVEGVQKAIDVMNKYHLSREDLDSLIELTKWPHTRDPMQSVDSKTKTAFTKAYNKHALFSSVSTMKKKSARDTQSEDFIGSDEEEVVSDNDEDDDKIENDKLIKAKTSKAKSAPSEGKSRAKKTVKNNSSGTKRK